MDWKVATHTGRSSGEGRCAPVHMAQWSGTEAQVQYPHLKRLGLEVSDVETILDLGVLDSGTCA